MVIPELTEVEAALQQFHDRLAALNRAYPGAAILITTALRDRCIRLGPDHFTLPAVSDTVEVAREQIELSIRQKQVLDKLTPEEKKTLRWPSLILF